MLKFNIKFLGFIFFFILSANITVAQIIKDIKVNGNQRISSPTIILFSNAKINEKIDEYDINLYLKNLYETNYFKNVTLKLENDILYINVEEEPIIQSVIFNGIKANKIIEPIRKTIKLKDRSSIIKIFYLEDKNSIIKTLQSLGYYFAEVTTSLEDLNDNKINLIYEINLGEKARIEKITFLEIKFLKIKN